MRIDWMIALGFIGVLCACPIGGSGDAADGTASDDGPACFEPFPWEIEGGPGFRNVVSGVERPAGFGTDETYTAVAYGQVDSDGIYDYAVASEDHDTIYIYYGSSDTGLTVFEDVAPDLWDIGTGGVVDVALADLDDDDLNELIALTTTDKILVWMGVDEDPWFDVGDPTEIDATHSTITGHSQMVIDDFNCDGYLDVAMPADDGGIVRYGDSMSLLGGGSYHIEMNTKSSHELAVSDLDEDNKPDLVASSTDDGEIFLLLGQCGTDPYPSYGVYDFDPGGIPSPNPHLAIVNMCGTTGDNPGIAIAYERVVHVICSDGSGSLANVIEPHGEEDPGGLGLDYFWNTQPLPGSGSIGAITSFGDHPELITLSGHAIVRLNRSSCGYFTGWSQALSQPLHGGTQPLNRIELVPSSNSANWRRIAVTGNLGLMILQ